MDKRKVKGLFLFPFPSVCIFFSLFFFLPVFIFFFPHFYLSIYICAYENLPRWAEISIYFQFLNCWLEFPLISQNFPSNLVRTFRHFLHSCKKSFLNLMFSYAKLLAHLGLKSLFSYWIMAYPIVSWMLLHLNSIFRIPQFLIYQLRHFGFNMTENFIFF